MGYTKAGKGSKWSQLKELGTKLNEKYYTNYAFKQDVEDQDTQIQAIINTQTYITLKKARVREQWEMAVAVGRKGW